MSEKPQNVEMTFWDHLEELRWVIIRSLIAIGAISIIAFLNKNFIFDNVFLAPKEPLFFTNDLLCRLSHFFNSEVLCMNQSGLEIINITMAGQFTTHIYTSFMMGLFLASPYIIFEFWRFITPALHSSEKKHTGGAVLISSILFILGVLFGYYLIVPFTINFLGGYHVSETIANSITLSSYLQNIISTSLWMGVVFEVPILIYLLTKIGIITPRFMRSSRKIVFIVLLTVAGIITPPDVISQIMVCIPLIFLYELSIKISDRVYRKNFM